MGVVLRNENALTAFPLKDPDLILGSPPYPGKWQRYGSKEDTPNNWADWMRNITTQLNAWSRPIVWVVNGSVSKGLYDCQVEELLVKCRDAGLRVERPFIWHKNPPPNRKDWLVNAWEYIIMVKPIGGLPTFNWEEIAEPPKYKAGGRFRQRAANGTRRLGGEYPQNKLARPRDVWYVPVGGGMMGSKLAHENEAPYPEALASRIIRLLTKPGDWVLDPFCGSGTTLAAAVKLGRNAEGWDIRESQVALSQRRLEEALAAPNAG